MGRQEGIVQITGSVGNLSFYKTKEDGYLVRQKSGVSRKRIMTDPAYVRTRENITEFGRGAQATRLVRRAFFPFIRTAADTRVTSRLTSVIMKIIKEDAVNKRGERVVTNDAVGRLQGFQFNKYAALNKAFRAPFTGSLDRASGSMVVDIPAFSPDNLIASPAGATHFRLTALGAAIDFANGTCSTVTVDSPDIPVDAKMQEPLRLTKTIAPGSDSPLFLVLAIEFLQVVNGVSNPLSDSAFNAMSMIRVDGTSLAVVNTEEIEQTEPVEEEDTMAVRSVDHAEVKTPERKRTPQPVVRERLLPEPVLRSRPARPVISERSLSEQSFTPLPVIEERLSREPSHWQLSDLGFHGQPLPAGSELFDNGGSIASFLTKRGYPISMLLPPAG